MAKMYTTPRLLHLRPTNPARSHRPAAAYVRDNPKRANGEEDTSLVVLLYLGPGSWEVGFKVHTKVGFQGCLLYWLVLIVDSAEVHQIVKENTTDAVAVISDALNATGQDIEQGQ
jgi:hypothetical protein